MTTLDDLVQLVEMHPTNPICLSMLTDQLMEERDMLRSEADAHVAHVAATAIDAAFLRKATAITGGCTWQRAWARSTVLEEAELPDGYTVTIMLIPGANPPTHHFTLSDSNEVIWHTGTILVGAQWLYHEYREFLAWRKEHMREVREAKRK